MTISKAEPNSKLGLGFALVLILSIAVPASAYGARRPQKHRARASAVKQAEVTPAVQTPAAPPTPQTLAQMPAVPAKVSYSNNLLTITARNSTMADILRAVQKQTGATMDFPPNAAERVIGQFGPGPARDVLASLFDGSNFNYVLLASPSDPKGVGRVIVTVKPPGPDFTPGPPQPQDSYAYEPPPQPEFPTAAPNPDQAPSEVMAPDQPSDTQPQDDDSDSDQQQNGNPPTVRTPEQLLQELQRQQQLQQQKQQNGAQPPQR